MAEAAAAAEEEEVVVAVEGSIYNQKLTNFI
jgi:hypothetical protein